MMIMTTFFIYTVVLLMQTINCEQIINVNANGEQFLDDVATIKSPHDLQLSNIYNITTFKRLIKWTKNHLDSQYGGVIISTGKRIIYPEVTGYFIPTLLQIGEHDLALSFGKALMKTQHKDGSFGLGHRGFVFDTAMVIRGLNELVMRQSLDHQYESNDGNEKTNFIPTLKAACTWLTRAIDPKTNRWTVPEGNIWGLPSGRGRISEGIHLLGILPLRRCGIILKNKEFVQLSELMEKRLITDLHSLELYDFTRSHHLSHFYAYIMEGLQELGHFELLELGMASVASFQKDDGSVPAYHDVNWVCSTGLSQIALVWLRMGDADSLSRASKALHFVFNELQDKKSFGFTGSKGEGATYFPYQQISWAVKYAIDATLAIPVAHFNHVVIDTFPTHLSLTDNRLTVVTDTIRKKLNHKKADNVIDVLDVGCGKGRFINAMHILHPDALSITGTDISIDMLRMAKSRKYVTSPTAIMPKYVKSAATSLPFPDNSFDIVYMVESMEHVLFVNATLRECHRILKNNGVLHVIDKTTDDVHQRSTLWELEKWEKWYGIEEFESFMHPLFGKNNVSSTRLEMEDGLFVAWTAIK